MSLGKEYFKGRLSAFKSVLYTMTNYNKMQIDFSKRVPSEVLDAIETLVDTTEGQVANAPDLGNGDLKSAMRVVGEYLVEAGKSDEEKVKDIGK